MNPHCVPTSSPPPPPRLSAAGQKDPCTHFPDKDAELSGEPEQNSNAESRFWTGYLEGAREEAGPWRGAPGPALLGGGGWERAEDGVYSLPPRSSLTSSTCWGYIESCEARIAPWVQGSRRGHLALPLPHQLPCLLPLKAQPPGMGGMGNSGAKKLRRGLKRGSPFPVH